ncbi:DNA internalization-related competence protein ComEC/Rec2 [Sulfurivermis fontis]|uniref:DNA internalization-related competence protein ComEC/Rec2 n=1 Tax=Sulfurivermis fontis TaxID=1972068 RepID=UPI000FD9E4A3|nr:DNA internalization-related competence protein ComEC/Rec2 [Sulfurivermis fontis]
MVAGTLAFLLGIVIFQWQADIPSAPWLILMLPLPLLPWWLPRAWQPSARLAALAAAGFLWAWLHAALVLAQQLPAALEGEDLVLEGVIATLPEADGRRSRFVFDTERLFYRGDALPPPGRVRLAWYQPYPVLEAGQRWRLQVRLKQPHGMANPGTFDYEGWLYQQRIRATGYVRPGNDTRLLAADSGEFPLQRLRQRLHAQLRAAVGEHPLGGLVAALALGERQDIGREQWLLLRATGTNHLVAISGLHIGIIAGLVFFLVRRLWPWPQRLPAPKAAALAALIAAALYAALAGFSLPTQRALIMVAVAMLALLGQRALRPARVLAVALLAVLLLDPLAVLSPGFWLSFGAVALILYGMGGRLGGSGWWWRWGRVQVLVALGLAPLLAVWFQQVPLLGALANLLAVPWVSLLVVPLVLLGTALLAPWPAAATALVSLALFGLEALWWWLEWCGGLLPPRWSVLAAVPWTLLPALAGLAWLLAPRGWPARWLGVIWLLPLLLVRPAGPAVGEAAVTVLDVGQGLAVLVRTANHALLYDTGPAYGPESDAGEMVLLPVLQHFGITRLDALILSHGDSDHAGGAAAVFQALAVGRFLSGAEAALPWRGHEPCARGQQWEWDGVRFEILFPATAGGHSGRGNDSSCVLRIVTPHGALLLAGDIEAAAEQALLAAVPEQLAADVLVAPHHGSKTSSTAPFVTAVAARHVLFSVGYRNRWGFPHPAVVARYRAAEADVHDTAQQGALTVRLAADGVQVESWRQRARRYWFSQ